MRAGNGTQIGLDNEEPDYVQFRVTAGHAAFDVREIPAGHTVEIDTPNAAFTIESKGYYHVQLSEDTTTLSTHRGREPRRWPSATNALSPWGRRPRSPATSDRGRESSISMVGC